MKSTILKTITLSLIITVSTSLTAQKIKVENESYKFNDGKKHAMKVNVYSDSHKEIIKAFLAEVEISAGSIEEKRKEAALKSVLVKSVSTSPLNVFIAVDNNKNGEAEFYASFEMNEEVLIPKSPAYQNAEALLIKIAKNVSLPVVTKALDRAKKELKKLEDKQKKLENNNKKLEKESRKLEAATKKNEKTLEKTNSELKKILSDMNSGKGKMDKLSKKKEKLDKTHNKSLDKVKKDKNKLNSNQDKIKSNNKEIDKIKSNIKEQAKKVDELKKKHNAVK